MSIFKKLILAIPLLCATSYAANDDLIGTWKAQPIFVDGEKIEREETLIITAKAYERTVGGEKRSGDLNIGQIPNNFGRGITFGSDTYQIRISADLKTLNLYKVIPEHRVQGGVASTNVGPLSMSYKRIGEVPANVKAP